MWIAIIIIIIITTILCIIYYLGMKAKIREAKKRNILLHTILRKLEETENE